MDPLVTVVIANYNYGRYLAEAIESVRQQDWPAVELIVIDDGSSDDSVAIASRYDLMLLVQANQGVCTARNNAAAHARGEFILFLDADDRLLPGAIRRLAGLLKAAGPEIGYAYGQMQYFGQRDGLFASRPFDATALARENYIPATTLLRKAAFDRVGGFDRGFTLREDWELFIRLFHAGYRGAFLAEPILHYRKHKPPTRRKTRIPKRIALTRLEYLYPRFFLRQILRHPLQHVYFRWHYRIGHDIRRYGPSGMPARVVKPAAVSGPRAP